MKATIWDTDLNLPSDVEYTKPAKVFMQLKPWIADCFSGAGTILKYGSIIVIAGLTFYYSTADLREGAWNDGCRAASNAEMCDYAARAGQQIRNVAKEISPGKLTPESEQKVTAICTDLRNSVPPGIAAHYGCP